MQDTQDIPLLRDVVAPDEIQFTENREAVDQKKTLDVVREAITTQLIAELQPAISTAINAAVEQATGEIKQILRDELQGTLQNRLRGLIDDALDRQMND